MAESTPPVTPEDKAKQAAASTPPVPPDPTPQVEQPKERISADDYKTNGRTHVSTPIGYRFEGNDLSIPAIDSVGLQVTREQAETLIEESDGLVTINDEKED